MSALTPGGRRRRRWPWVLGALVLLAGAAVAAYFAFVKAPGNVSHPNVEFTAPQAPPKHRVSGAGVDLPLYGYTTQRSRYMYDARLQPPFLDISRITAHSLIWSQPLP